MDGSSLTTISGSVTITNTATGFTLSGFTITGGVDFESNKGALTLSDLIVSATGNTGITVSGQQGTTTLSNVKVSNSANAGVQISNQNGAVTLSNLSVSTSSGEGIEVSSRSGAITLTNVESNDNKGNGAKIDNSIFTSAAPISITNSEFNDNNASSGDAEGYGLYISPAGAVTLDGVSANGNIGDGLDIISPKAAVIIHHQRVIMALGCVFSLHRHRQSLW